MRIVIDTQATSSAVKAFCGKHKRKFKIAGIAAGVVIIGGVAYVVCRKTGAHTVVTNFFTQGGDVVIEAASTVSETVGESV